MSGEKKTADLDFFGHLEILRKGIMLTCAAFTAAAVSAFAGMDRIVPFLTAPALRAGMKLFVFSPVEKFTAYLKMSALLGAVAALPVALALLFSFVAPAFGQRARRTMAAGTVIVFLFVLSGAALAWFVMLPFALGFFAGFATGDGIAQMWSLGSYVSLAVGLIAAMSLVCLAPPVLLALIGLGVLDVASLSRARRYVIVAIAIVAGVITPTVDVVSQCIVGACMWGLFEITLVIGRIITLRKKNETPIEEVLDGQT